jgi:hypothetical protein
MVDQLETPTWYPASSAPVNTRVRVRYRNGTIKIARQINFPIRGWIWRSDFNEEPNVGDPVVSWAELE